MRERRDAGQQQDDEHQGAEEGPALADVQPRHQPVGQRAQRHGEHDAAERHRIDLIEVEHVTFDAHAS